MKVKCLVSFALLSFAMLSVSAQNAFFDAISEGDTAKVRELLENKKVKIKYKNKEGVNAVMKASESGNSYMVEFLVERKAVVDAKDKNGITALMRASFLGDTAIVRYLVKQKIKIDNTDNDGNTALIIAADTGNMEVVKILVDNGADINIRNKINTNPILRASENGYTDIVLYLIEKGADINVQDYDGLSPLMYAVVNQDFRMIKALVEKNADLHLMDKGKYRFTALVYASESGKFQIVRYLLDKIEKDEKVDTAFVKYQKGQALLIATKKKYPEIMLTLLKHGADPDEVNRDGFTSLMYATMDGDADLVRLLLVNKADPNIKHFFQSKTALDWAREKHFKQIEKMILQAGGKEGWEVQ